MSKQIEIGDKVVIGGVGKFQGNIGTVIDINYPEGFSAEYEVKMPAQETHRGRWYEERTIVTRHVTIWE